MNNASEHAAHFLGDFNSYLVVAVCIAIGIGIGALASDKEDEDMQVTAIGLCILGFIALIILITRCVALPVYY